MSHSLLKFGERNSSFKDFYRSRVTKRVECDTYELSANKTIRFINNPFYTGEPSNINIELGFERKQNTNDRIREYLEDYDYNQKGIMTYMRICNDLDISLITVKRYRKEYDELKEMYKAVKKGIILK